MPIDGLMSMYKQYKTDNPDIDTSHAQHKKDIPDTTTSSLSVPSSTPVEKMDNNPILPQSSDAEPTRYDSTKTKVNHTTEISQSQQSTSYYDGIPTLPSTNNSFESSVRSSVQLYKPEVRSVTADTVGSPRKVVNRMGRVRKTTQGATPPSWFMPITILTIGVLFTLAGLILTIMGFTVKSFSSTITLFMRAAGPILLGLGITALISGYIYFNIVYGRHSGGNRKDEEVPPPDPAKDMANGQWGMKQRSPQQNEQAVMLFQTQEAKQQREDAETKVFSKVSSDKTMESPESNMFVADRIRESSKKLINRAMDSGSPSSLVPGHHRHGKLPPLSKNASIPDSTRESVRTGKKKTRWSKNREEPDGYVWREEDFEPMSSTPKDPSVFVVGAGGKSSSANGTMDKRLLKREREGGY